MTTTGKESRDFPSGRGSRGLTGRKTGSRDKYESAVSFSPKTDEGASEQVMHAIRLSACLHGCLNTQISYPLLLSYPDVRHVSGQRMDRPTDVLLLPPVARVETSI